jgi:conjugative relaxase-like TrwC/TraI family protein
MHQGCVRSRQRRREGSGGVVADIAKLSVGREEYYTCELADNHEQYLSGHGESPGRWYGAGATSLGLQGEASRAGFQRMFEGRHPTPRLLGRPHVRNAVPAFDVVLRPTKSVSILYGLGDAATGRAVLAAHHAGVAEATAYLDDHLGVRRGHGGHQHVSGQGLLAVGFDHRTSREGDPLLHTHLVVVLVALISGVLVLLLARMRGQLAVPASPVSPCCSSRLGDRPENGANSWARADPASPRSRG